MKKPKMEKTHILIAVYIFLIVTELFFCVPYHNIQIFRSQQNVPHTIIVGSGYATMDDIKNDNAYLDTKKSRWAPSEIGKKVNTPQLFMNVSITTILAIVIYFLIQKKEKKTIEENIPIPVLDINGLAFATEEEIVQAQQDYARKIVEYVNMNK